MVNIALMISLVFSCSLSHSRYERKLEECINRRRLALVFAVLEANKDNNSNQKSIDTFPSTVVFVENTAPAECKDSLHRRGYNDGPFP